VSHFFAILFRMNGNRWLPETVPRALGHLRVALEDAYGRASSEVGLTPVYAELLCAAMAPASISRLAEGLRCDRTNVTRLVDRATVQGWVERAVDQSDRRRSLVTLTPKGERVARRFILTLESQLTDLLATWGEGRKRRAVADITAIAAELDRSASVTGSPPTRG
jgi:DNA-binding MarR family transcriptional regulator